MTLSPTLFSSSPLYLRQISNTYFFPLTTVTTTRIPKCSYSKVLTILPTARPSFLDSVVLFFYSFRRGSVYVMETSRNADIPFSPSSHAADVIIRSSDDVDFYVMKGLLALSSPDSFETMFSLPQAENIQSQGGLQIVPVTEESRTLRALLLSCYPQGICDETSDGDDIAKAILAAQKYAMDVAEKVLMQTLLSHPVLVEKPLHMYALACHYGLHDLVRVAAKNTLRFPVSKLSPSAELDYISGMDVY
jgi:BTB/POZ domain